jgi:hypothetical protein
MAICRNYNNINVSMFQEAACTLVILISPKNALMKRPAYLSVAPQKFKLNILRICVYFNFEKRNTIVTPFCVT